MQTSAREEDEPDTLERLQYPMVLPFVKLGLLAVKQVSKPVASRIKSSALRSDVLQKAMVRVGRGLHYNAFQLERIADGKGALKKERVPTLDSKAAMERGSDFLAEMVVFTIGVGVLGIEQWHSKSKETAKAEKEELKQAAKDAEARRLKELNERQQWAELSGLREEVLDRRSNSGAEHALTLLCQHPVFAPPLEQLSALRRRLEAMEENRPRRWWS
jgi:hypothetical protein